MKNNEERLDDLLIGGMKLWQRTDQFRFAIDAVLLAHFPKLSEKRRYADLGTGTGVIPLLMTALGAKQITVSLKVLNGWSDLMQFLSIHHILRLRREQYPNLLM